MSPRTVPGGASPFRRRGLLAAGLIGVSALATTLIALTAGSSRPVSAALPGHPIHRAAAGSSGTAGAVATRSGGGCHTLPVSSMSIPAAPPPARWVRVGVMSEPSDPAIGPQRRVHGVGECFAHDPLGALYAAANVLAALTAEPQATVIATLAADTPARAPALAGARVGYNPTLQATLGGTPSISGFAFESYSAEQADVDVVLSLASGAESAIELSCLWQDGDWRFVIPPGGNLVGAAVDSLDGYVPWGSV